MVHAVKVASQGMVSIGVAAGLGPELVAELASAIEDAGFHALWVNDTPGADSLAVFEAASGATSRLRLATGVVPIDRRRPAEIAAALEARRLPQERLRLGIGAGGATTGALALVRDAVSELRGAVSATILVGAL